MLFAELKDVDRQVIKGIHRVVAERGADWRYPNGRVDGGYIEGAVTDPEWSEDGSCYNLLHDGSGACIIGTLAVDQGLPTTRSSSAGSDADRWEVSPVVYLAMREAQQRQDTGYTWGVALEAFDRVLSTGNHFTRPVGEYAEGLAALLAEDA